jgi:CheY-like chemotaxis protein
MDAHADSSGGSWGGDDSEPRARVLVASRDPRFVRLARFLLEGRDLEVEELTTPERLPDAILEPTLNLAVLDCGNAIAEALRTANAARARRPEVPIVIAADTGGKSPAGVRVFDRWNETEELLLDIERLLAERAPEATPIVRG